MWDSIDEIYIIISVTFFALLSIILFVVGPAIQANKHTPSNYQSFLENLKKAATARNLTWSQIQVMAETDGVSRETIGKALRTMLSSAYQDEKSDEQFITNLENILDNFKKDEPFERIPQDVRIHLERLRERLQGKETTLLEALANKLRELNDLNSSERAAERRKSTWSLVFGAIGIIFAVVSIAISLILTR